MDRLDFLSNEELLRFFRCTRTEMSCMEQPHIFISQLRDYDLIPDEMFKRLIRKRSKEQREKGLYQALEWIEENKSDCIQQFWRCVYKDHLLHQYPVLLRLRNSLFDGSFTIYEELPGQVEKKAEGVKGKKKDLGSGDEQAGGEGKKKKKKKGNVCSEEEEQPSTSTQTTQSAKKKVQKPVFSSTKKGEKADFWNWPLYKTQLPVTCGDQRGTLYRDKLARGGDCILANGQWFTLSGFEEFGGNKKRTNWKTSICCGNTPLGKLIQEGHLTSPRSKRNVLRSKRVLFPSNQSERSVTGHEDSEEEEVEQEAEEGEQTTPAGGDSSPGGSQDDLPKSVFKVTCGSVDGILDEERFASGTCGKSIRTEQSWMTPMEFVKKGLGLADASWQKSIVWCGKPLRVLIENESLHIHSLLCLCKLCHPTGEDLQNQENDDNCFICQREGSLLCCESCPRSFHQLCHLPNVEDSLLHQPWRRPDQNTYQGVLNYRTSDHLMECQYLLLSLYHEDEYHIFVEDPRIRVRNYSTVIKTPMWLDEVTRKLQNKQYQTVKHFVTDVLLIFTNCATFNRDNSEFSEMGERMKDLFDSEFRKTFSVRLQ
ncbi:hypothetical protein DPEC_G00275060 [Dallia pectoralis]|uniref:Uncharacterized protein n=1 Tax=Dallia pectoralis TaxID=75939 RepID=A0ACC2FLA4_DALPE|nr:hypothetical protein DPEC_G00275060 [Dallia pectoralis]